MSTAMGWALSRRRLGEHEGANTFHQLGVEGDLVEEVKRIVTDDGGKSPVLRLNNTPSGFHPDGVFLFTGTSSARPPGRSAHEITGLECSIAGLRSAMSHAIGHVRRREVYFDSGMASSSSMGILSFRGCLAPTPAEGSMRQTAGFTLVELMVVVTILAILISFAFSNMQSGRKGANEASTIAFFKQAVISNQQYRTRFGRFPATFNDLVQFGFFADGQNPSGYSLTYFSAVESWSFQGSPQIAGQTGDRYFYVDQVGVIRADPSAPANSTSTPIE